MKNYVGLTIDVCYLSQEDVITTSGNNDLYESDCFPVD